VNPWRFRRHRTSLYLGAGGHISATVDPPEPGSSPKRWSRSRPHGQYRFAPSARPGMCAALFEVLTFSWALHRGSGMGGTSFLPVMPNWEYKIITSGSLGFGSLALLEQHLNLLGKEEWEIIHFQTRPDNPLAFNGVARRPVIRDWVVDVALPSAGSATKSGAVPPPPSDRQASAPSTEELRAEAEERRESLLSQEDSLRPVRGTDDEEDDADEAAEAFDDLENDEDLPTFFEARKMSSPAPEPKSTTVSPRLRWAVARGLPQESPRLASAGMDASCSGV